MEVSHPKRILYVITKGNWGGAQRYVFDMAAGAASAGYSVAVAYGTPGEMVTRLEAAGIPTHRIAGMERDINLISELSSFSSLLRLIKELKPDVLHSNSSKAGLSCLAARMLGVPRIIFTAHGWAFNEARPAWQRLILWWLHYATVLLSDVTICVSHAARKDARTMLFAHRKLRVIRNGISTPAFIERTEARATLAADIEAETWIGSIAELHPTKQLHILIEAFAQLLPSFPSSALILMGEGSERTHLERLIIHRGIQNSVRLCGHVSRASEYLKALDIFVLPSRSEGLAYVLLEAGAAALPVIASNAGGIPEIIETSKTGTLVPSGSVNDLADALRAYLENPVNTRSYGTSLKSKVESEFSLDQMVEKTIGTY